MIKYLVIFLLILKTTYALTEISEIMYNPEGSDNNHEYIEIYSDEIFNLTNFTIEDSSSQDNLKLLYYYPSNYFLIVEEGFNYSSINTSIYSAGKTIGNGLNNDNDILILRNNTKPMAVESYSNYLGANGNNKSLCKINSILKECTATPGYENVILTNYTLLINELLPDPEGYDNSSLPQGEWIELYDYGDKELETEGLIIKDNSNKEIVISRSNVINSTIIEPKSYLVVYMNGFFGFLNNNGFEKIYLISNDTTIDSFSYSDTEEALSWSRINNSFIRTVPTPTQENVYNEELLESRIIIKSKNIAAQFGDTIKVKLYVQKGNTNKNSVDLKVINSNNEPVSKESSFNLFGKFTNTSVVIPIQLKPLCNPKNTTYEIIASGFSVNDNSIIDIKENKELCKRPGKKIEKVKTKTEKRTRGERKKEKNINTSKITSNAVYESPEIKTKKASVYIFMLSLIAIIIVLTLRI